MSDTPSKPREYVGINPGGNSNALISVLIPEDFYALMGSSSRPDKIELVEKSALVAAQAELSEAAETIELYAAEAEIRKHWAEELKAEIERLTLKLKEFDEYYTFSNVNRLEAELETAQKECEEQARLSGMGAQRELKLMTEIDRLKAKFAGANIALDVLAVRCNTFKEQVNALTQELEQAKAENARLKTPQQLLAEPLATADLNEMIRRLKSWNYSVEPNSEIDQLKAELERANQETDTCETAKPRAWVIWDDNVANGPTVPDDETVHVVEYSALVAAETKLKEARDIVERQCNTVIKIYEKWTAVEAENVELKAEIERLNKERQVLLDEHHALDGELERANQKYQNVKLLYECQKVTSYTEEQYKALQLLAESYRAILLKFVNAWQNDNSYDLKFVNAWQNDNYDEPASIEKVVYEARAALSQGEKE